MIKEFLTKWQVWAFLCGVLLIGALLQIETTETVPRRDYMTEQEFNKAYLGISQKDFLKVTHAKPAIDVHSINDKKFIATYKNQEETAAYIFLIETKEDGELYITQKQATQK